MSTSKYIVNIDELIDALKQLTNFEELQNLLSLLQDSIGRGDFFSHNMSNNIPALAGSYEQVFHSREPVSLRAITFACTGYNKQDCVSMIVDGKTHIDRIHTKELGQYKDFFNAITGNEVKVIYHNVSGHSKMFWCDIDYFIPQEK
ncbi:MAG: hypothetical protein ATN35_02170 [Epulopiscium sp. Nele67-Bin004]|nr:MAG: hypothetical protein ATN35_02170 [Epulopiscium sp. Nele67-Bin004]